jgi:AraC-like DNA-binding protein
VRVKRYETDTGDCEIARRSPLPQLQPYIVSELEGWHQTRGGAARLREVPFPGVPLIFNLGPSWHIEGGVTPGQEEHHDSFLAGLHTKPSFVDGGDAWACIELRMTPLGAYRLLQWPMHELTNRTLELGDVLARVGDLVGRLRETGSWEARFDLVEAFLMRRLGDAAPPSAAMEWSWDHLHRSHGGAPISALANELGWSHRRLISRFREQLGLTPKVLARVIRFDQAVRRLGHSTPDGLAAIAYDCGYFDQAHMNRDFRELAGTTPAALVGARTEVGGVTA